MFGLGRDDTVSTNECLEIRTKHTYTKKTNQRIANKHERKECKGEKKYATVSLEQRER